MKNFKLYLSFGLLAWILASCEKDITVDLPEVEKKVVVDGAVFIGEHPSVALTYSFPYFTNFAGLDLNDPNEIGQFIVLDAKVTISDGVFTEHLEMGFDNTKFPPLVYKADTLVGVPGRSYTLTIDVAGKTYTAVTSIPNPVALDSIRWFKEVNKDSLGTCRLYFTEPATPGNIYRLFVKRQGYPAYVPIDGFSVINDQAYNGTQVEYPFGRPNAQSSVFTANNPQFEEDETRGYWVKGDTVYARFCSIDAISYEYIRTLEQAASISGNPFSNPVTVKSNVTGGALGGFVGYGQFDIVYHIP